MENNKILYAHKTRIHVNNQQANYLVRCAGVRRIAYRWALEEWGRQYDHWVEMEKRYSVWKALHGETTLKNKRPNAYDIDKLFNKIKKTKYPWVSEVPSCITQEAIKHDLKKAFDRFFRGLGYYPKSPKRGKRLSATFTNVVIRPVHITNTHLTFPKKWGAVRIADPIRYSGKLMKTTVCREGGKWYAVFTVETTEIVRDAAPNKTVGIDLGVVNAATLSDGTVYQPVKAFLFYQKRLKRAQRKLERMEKFSNNWNKQRDKINKIHRKIATVRSNTLHHISRDITNKYNQIGIEDLNTTNMTKSAKGDALNPGKNVKAKSGLNRSILDVGFYELRRQLEYKAKWRNSIVVAVDPKYTSQTCPACTYKNADNRKTQALFHCVECGFKDNADYVGAINVEQRMLHKLCSTDTPNGC